jgi:hypothetical protein
MLIEIAGEFLSVNRVFRRRAVCGPYWSSIPTPFSARASDLWMRRDGLGRARRWRRRPIAAIESNWRRGDAWAEHLAQNRPDHAGNFSGKTRIAVSGTAPDGRSGRVGLVLGRIGKQPAREVLPSDQSRRAPVGIETKQWNTIAEALASARKA